MKTIIKQSEFRKSLIILIALLSSTQIFAQIQLTVPLLDSLIAKSESSKLTLVSSLRVLNIASFPDRKNTLYFSETPLKNSIDITEDMSLYINASDMFLVLFKGVSIDSSLSKKLVPFGDERFNMALDSIKFRNHNLRDDGVVVIRLSLRVYKIKRKFLNKSTYIISSRNYIPYLSAPEILIPLKRVSDGHISNEIDMFFYEGYGKTRKLNKKYYEEVKPGKKIILRMKKR